MPVGVRSRAGYIKQRPAVAGPRELVHSGSESFIGGYRWQCSGLGLVAQGGVAAVAVESCFQSLMTTRGWISDQKLVN